MKRKRMEQGQLDSEQLNHLFGTNNGLVIAYLENKEDKAIILSSTAFAFDLKDMVGPEGYRRITNGIMDGTDMALEDEDVRIYLEQDYLFLQFFELSFFLNEKSNWEVNVLAKQSIMVKNQFNVSKKELGSHFLCDFWGE